MSQNRAQRRAASRNHKTLYQRIQLDRENEKGFQEGKSFASKMMCASIALSLQEKYGFTREQIMVLFQDAVNRMFSANCPSELLEEAEKKCGVEQQKFDFYHDDMEDLLS